MQRHLLRLVLLVAPLLVAASELFATTGHTVLSASELFAVEDDTCDVGDAECALELRQLRARVVAPSVQLHTELPAAEEEEEEEETEGGLPGGWGEPAELQRELQEGNALGSNVLHGGNGTLSKLPKRLTASRGWHSCAAYGCSDKYVAGRRCQCNSACVERRNCCYDYYSNCRKFREDRRRTSPPPPASNKGSIKTLYHATSQEAGPLILKNGFMPGTQGWCGGGIYFAESVEHTTHKAIGPDSHQGFLIEAVVNVGTVKYMGKECDRKLTAQALWNDHFDSVSFDPGDGREWIVYSKDRILSMKKYR